MAVVGAGTMGTMYLRALSQSARAVPVAVCDLDLARAQAVANEFGVEHTYRDQTEMQERHELDAVVVATPDAHHRGPVLEALAHGAHVLCEKPLAVTVEDCLEMTQAAKSHGRRLMVNFGNRHRKEVRLVRQEIAEGALGVIGHAYMRLNERVDKTRTLGWIGSTSPTWFLHSHLVDLVCFVLGPDVEEVFGYQYVGRVARESETDVPDTAVYLLRMRSGAIVTLESSWALPESFPSDVDIELTVVGDKGMLRTPLSSGVEKYATRHGSVRWDLEAQRFDGVVEGWWFTSCEYFLHCVQTGTEPRPNGQDGTYVTRVLVAMSQSTSSGVPVRLER